MSWSSYLILPLGSSSPLRGVFLKNSIIRALSATSAGVGRLVKPRLVRRSLRGCVLDRARSLRSVCWRRAHPVSVGSGARDVLDAGGRAGRRWGIDGIGLDDLPRRAGGRLRRLGWTPLQPAAFWRSNSRLWSASFLIWQAHGFCSAWRAASSAFSSARVMRLRLKAGFQNTCCHLTLPGQNDVRGGALRAWGARLLDLEEIVQLEEHFVEHGTGEAPVEIRPDLGERRGASVLHKAQNQAVCGWNCWSDS